MIKEKEIYAEPKITSRSLNEVHGYIFFIDQFDIQKLCPTSLKIFD